MILTKYIPISAADLIRRCGTDIRLGRFAADGNYLDYLIAETEKSHAKLLEYLRVIDRRSGQPRYYAQADHIIPRSVWPLLMPRELRGPGAPDGNWVHSLSNLFWRGPQENRSHDQASIRMIQDEAPEVARRGPMQYREWADRWIEIFLLTKRDEALVFSGDLVNLSVLSKMPARGGGTNWMGG
jgi:hypothetical protein